MEELLPVLRSIDTLLFIIMCQLGVLVGIVISKG